MNDLVDPNGSPLLATAIGENLANSEHWKEVTPDEAQELANSGTIVIVAGGNHVATVRPENVPGDTPVPSSRGPLINDIGRNVRIGGVNWAFRKGTTVHYYTPK
jgi:hypothetical protein